MRNGPGLRPTGTRSRDAPPAVRQHPRRVAGASLNAGRGRRSRPATHHAAQPLARRQRADQYALISTRLLK